MPEADSIHCPPSHHSLQGLALCRAGPPAAVPALVLPWEPREVSSQGPPGLGPLSLAGASAWRQSLTSRALEGGCTGFSPPDRSPL